MMRWLCSCWLGGWIGRGGFFLLSWVIALPTFAEEPLRASHTLERMARQGVVRVGVKADFAPFGSLNAQAEPVGFEVDLAADIARRLGLTLKPVTVTTENRFQKLKQGEVDLLIATTGDTVERRELATAVEPHYYQAGVGVLLIPEQKKISDWQALRGQKLCAVQSSYFNRPMSQRYLLDLEVYRSVRDALLALRDRRCVGLLYAEGAIQNYLTKPEWTGYHAPLPRAMPANWAIFVSHDDQGTYLEQVLGDIVSEWHRSGYLISVEKKWNMPANSFLRSMSAQWRKRNADGDLVCRRDAKGAWPQECRQSSFMRSTEATGLLRIGLMVYESTGIKLTFLYDEYDRSFFFKGILFTILLILGSVIWSLVVGACGAMVADSRHKWLARMAHGVAAYGRMTPPLLQMYLVFFGLAAVFAIKLPGMLVAIVCMGYYTGASIMTYIVEAVAVKRSQVGHEDFKLTFSSLRDLADLCITPIRGALINVAKQSVLASALAVPELATTATSIMADQGNMGVMMNAFIVTFLLILSGFIHMLELLEKKLIRVSHTHAAQ